MKYACGHDSYQNISLQETEKDTTSKIRSGKELALAKFSRPTFSDLDTAADSIALQSQVEAKAATPARIADNKENEVRAECIKKTEDKTDTHKVVQAKKEVRKQQQEAKKGELGFCGSVQHRMQKEEQNNVP